MIKEDIIRNLEIISLCNAEGEGTVLTGNCAETRLNVAHVSLSCGCALKFHCCNELEVLHIGK